MIQHLTGAYSHSEKTSGILSSKEYTLFLSKLVKRQVLNTLEKLSYQAGLFNHKLKRVNLDAISIPDTIICKEAIAVAKSKYSEALLNHCFRSYFFGSLLGQVEQYQIDYEVLFTSSILHDIGLADAHIHKASSCCFAVEGARFAMNFTQEMGWPQEKALAVYTAISAHLSPDVDAKRYGQESRLLSEAAVMDVIGSRIHTIPKASLHKVLCNYPRANFKNEIIKTMQEVGHVKYSRASILSKLGMARQANNNPLDKVF